MSMGMECHQHFGMYEAELHTQVRRIRIHCELELRT